jgi:hypothetical protein
MVLCEENLDLCSEKLGDLDENELRQLIDDMIIHNWDKNELINFIENNFTNDDWEWFFEEYVKED